jgi:hypothetical protein
MTAMICDTQEASFAAGVPERAVRRDADATASDETRLADPGSRMDRLQEEMSTLARIVVFPFTLEPLIRCGLISVAVL